jgi:hypothetical protein
MELAPRPFNLLRRGVDFAYKRLLPSTWSQLSDEDEGKQASGVTARFIEHALRPHVKACPEWVEEYVRLNQHEVEGEERWRTAMMQQVCGLARSPSISPTVSDRR